MGLVAATVGLNPAQLSAAPGQRIVACFWSRGGSQVAAVTPDAGGASWQQVVAEPTLPLNGSARRSLAVFTLDPVSAVSAVTFTASWVGDSTQGIWLVAEEGAGYELAGSAVADSGTGTVNQLGTGTVASIPAGDRLAVAAVVSRDGDGPGISWLTTQIEPALVGGGTVLLDVYDGAGVGGGNAGAAGYLTAADQASGDLSDQITLPGADTRMLTVALVVWAAPSTGGEAHSGDGLPAALTLTPAAGQGTPTIPGDGTAVALTLTPGTGAGSPSIVGIGQPVTLALAPAGGQGSPAIAGTGQAASVVLTPATGSGTGQVEGDHSGNGQPSGLVLAPAAGIGTPQLAGAGQPVAVLLALGAGLGAPALVGAGQACTLILTPEVGTDVEVVTPPERTSVVPAESRRLAVGAESRVLTVEEEVRRVDVPA